MVNWRCFFRDVKQEWNYHAPSCCGSRVWIRVWQFWNLEQTTLNEFEHRKHPWMRRYWMILLAPLDFADRFYWAVIRRKSWTAI